MACGRGRQILRASLAIDMHSEHEDSFCLQRPLFYLAAVKRAMKRSAAHVLQRPAAHVLRRPAPSQCERTCVSDMQAWAEEIQLGPDEVERNHSRTLYLITFSRLLSTTASATHLRDPSVTTREEIRDVVFDAVENPMIDRAHGGRPRTRESQLVHTLIVVREQPRGWRHLRRTLLCGPRFMTQAMPYLRHSCKSYAYTRHALPPTFVHAMCMHI